MALGVNIQLGYAGIFNAGVMGFAALGGLAAVIISYPPVPETIQAWWIRSFSISSYIISGCCNSYIYLINPQTQAQ